MFLSNLEYILRMGWGPHLILEDEFGGRVVVGEHNPAAGSGTDGVGASLLESSLDVHSMTRDAGVIDRWLT